MNHSQPLFFDVEETDRAAVLKRFPKARFADADISGDALVSACQGAEIVSPFITTHFPRSVLEKLPSLRLLCTRSVGYDHIDMDACAGSGITVCNVPDYGSHVIAEHVFALLLSAMRHIPEAGKRVESGTFDYHGLRGMALRGKTIGILGTGKIGRTVARIAHGFGMTILATDVCRTLEIERDYGVRYVPFEELIASSEVLTLHAPATKDTEHLLNAKTFADMKKGMVLVNTARGSLIDTKALLKALNDGTVAHALLDVLEHEQNFAENKAIVGHPSVVVTPHIAFYADDSMRNMYNDCFDSIDQWLAGTVPAHIVRPLTVICDLPSARTR